MKQTESSGKKRGGSNQVRIVGGQWRGRKIRFPDVLGLRPTPDSVRERLFNWLGQDLTGYTVLDAFAGSGALGLEAASRYAKQVLLVERQQAVVRALLDSVRMLDAAGQVQVHGGDVLGHLKRDDGLRFDLVFADPPFVWQEWSAFFEVLQPRLLPAAWVYVEAARLPDLPECFEIYREGKAGMSRHALLRFIGEVNDNGL